jgi:hypothetical protein
MNNEIGTKINNSVNLQGHVHVNDKEAGKTLATQVGITGAMVGGALGVSKAIAKSPMPPLQKAGVIVGASVASGIAQTFISASSGALSRNTSTSITTSAASSVASNSINKLIDVSQGSPLQNMLFLLEIMDYTCLSMIYILIIQLIFKLYFKDTVRLGLSK